MRTGFVDGSRTSTPARVLAWICALFLMLCAWPHQQATAATTDSPWANGYIPNVSVVDQDGRPLAFYDDLIKGKVVVVNFIYTTCRDLCPLMTARLARLQDLLGAAVGRDIFFVSVTIDPERDTPDKLKEHSEAFRTGPGWTFVTGRREDIDVIRYRLGERSRALVEHRNQILLGNDRTGNWAHDSAFSDLNTLAGNVRAMDPAHLHVAQAGHSVAPGTATPPAQERLQDVPGQTLYTKTCASCHTIGRGERVGPDLAGVLQRRTREWLASYLAAPNLMRHRQDPIAMELAQRYRAVRMPNLALSPADIEDLLAYLEARGNGRKVAKGHAGDG